MREGWEIKKLGEVLVKTETFDPTKNPNSNFTYLDVSSVNKETKEVENPTVLLGKDAPSRARKLVKTNDVIFATVRPTHGRVALITEEYNEQVCSTGYFVLRGKEFIYNKLLFYFLLTHEFNKQMEKLQKGASYPAVTDAEVKSIFLHYPKSLIEQHRIVAILDEIFTSTTKAKAKAEQNFKNAKELFESYLQDVFENKGECWEEKRFEDVCDLIGGSQPSKDDFIYEPKAGYIRLIQVRDYRTSKYITYIPQDKARRFCSKDDIMIGRYGPPIFGIFKGLEGAYNVALMKAEVNTKICNPDYFYWFLKTNKLRIFVEHSSKRAAGQDGIRKELLDKYPVPLPKSLKTQQAIVYKLDSLSTETKKLEAIYQEKINHLEELKKSILQKAFSGELTNQLVLS